MLSDISFMPPLVSDNVVVCVDAPLERSRAPASTSRTARWMVASVCLMSVTSSPKPDIAVSTLRITSFQAAFEMCPAAISHITD